MDFQVRWMRPARTLTQGFYRCLHAFACFCWIRSRVAFRDLFRCLWPSWREISNRNVLPTQLLAGWAAGLPLLLPPRSSLCWRVFVRAGCHVVWGVRHLDLTCGVRLGFRYHLLETSCAKSQAIIDDPHGIDAIKKLLECVCENPLACITFPLSVSWPSWKLATRYSLWDVSCAHRRFQWPALCCLLKPSNFQWVISFRKRRCPQSGRFKKPHQFICMLDVLGGHMESYLVFYGFVKWIPAQVPGGPYHSAETFGGFARCCPICQRIERYRRVMGSVVATHCFPQNRWCVGFRYPAVIWMWFHTSHG